MARVDGVSRQPAREQQREAAAVFAHHLFVKMVVVQLGVDPVEADTQNHGTCCRIFLPCMEGKAYRCLVDYGRPLPIAHLPLVRFAICGVHVGGVSDELGFEGNLCKAYYA